MLAERDALYEGCTNNVGEYSDNDEGERDREAVAEMDKIIDRAQAAIAGAENSNSN